MSFPFRCPHCGAESEAVDSQIGQTGDCHACGRPVTVLPPVSQMTSPSAAMSAVAGAILGAALFLATIGLGYTLPELWSVQQLRGVSSADVVDALVALAVWTFVGGGLGAGFLATAAALSNTRAAFCTVRTGALAGLVFGGIVGAVAAAVRSALGLVALYNELSLDILLGGFIGALLGALAAYLLANARERALLDSIVFEAGRPADPEPNQEAPIVAAVVDEEWSDQELTSERRQALIRRLGQSRQDASEQQ